MHSAGMRKLAKKLAGIPSRLEAGMAEALSASAARAAGAARQNVPVDTGQLRGSISHSGTGLSARVLAAAPHAGFVEYGTRHAPPRPIMLPAARDARGELKQRSENCLKEILK